jgi:2-polyprenyl-3-methyl-5-hydroxy-6-metoxy-1,4-benzoquinol methylase
MALLIDPEGCEIAALEAMVPTLEGAHVIEIGCGDGRLTRRYAARAASVLAIDPPAGVIEIRAQPIDRLEVPDHAADVVLLSWSL